MTASTTTRPALRRRALAVAGVAAVGLVAACGSSSSTGASASPSAAASAPMASAMSSAPMSSPAMSSGMGMSSSAMASAMTSTMSSTAGAGGASVTVDGATITVDAAAAAALPAALKSKGTITVAADASYAPNEFFDTDGKTVIGMDADLAKALGGALGLKVSVVNAGFDSIIPGLAAGKYDLGMSSFTDTKLREKTVDFVTYFSAGTSFYIKTGGTAINTLADLGGQKVAVEKGTTQADDATAQSATCKRDGKATVDVQVYPDQNGANLAISTGRAAVGMADSPVAAYQVELSKGQFALSGKAYGTAPYGIAIPKDNKVASPVLLAVRALIADGAYTKILAKWGTSAGAITSPVVNGATS